MSSTPDTGARQPPFTAAELLEVPIEPGDIVIDPAGDFWYLVLGTTDVPAGEYQLDDGLGTVAEWESCAPDAPVVEAVDLDEMEEKTNNWESIGDVRQGVANGRIQLRAIPENRLVPALDEFAEARRAGEWDGLAAYVDEVRR